MTSIPIFKMMMPSHLILVLIAVVQHGSPVPVAETPECLTELAELLNNEAVITGLNDEFANFISGIGPVEDNKFELAVPELLQLSGSYAGVKLQLTPPKFVNFYFEPASFELYLRILLDAQRIEGTKYEVDGTVRESKISGSGGPFNFELDGASFSAVIGFESEGFDCALNNYKVKDLSYYYTLGDFDINLPGLTVNGQEIKNKEELNRRFRTLVQDLLWKLDQLARGPVSPDLVQAMMR